MQIPHESCWKRAGSRGWQVPGGRGVYSVTQERRSDLGLQRPRSSEDPCLPLQFHPQTSFWHWRQRKLQSTFLGDAEGQDFLRIHQISAEVRKKKKKKNTLECKRVKRAGSAVTYEQILPYSLRESGAHRLKIKTSSVISCSSGCFRKKEWRYELYFPPPSELIIASQPFSGPRVSWWSQEQATKEEESEGSRSAVCCICVSHCSNRVQKVKHG